MVPNSLLKVLRVFNVGTECAGLRSQASKSLFACTNVESPNWVIFTWVKQESAFENAYCALLIP